MATRKSRALSTTVAGKFTSHTANTWVMTSQRSADRRPVSPAPTIAAVTVCVLETGTCSAPARYWIAAVADWATPGTVAVAGGSTRAASVANGLAAVPPAATVICVHDAARPLASADLYARVVEAVVAGADGAVPGLPVVDTIKVVDGGAVTGTPDRASLVAVQTPQAFRADRLRAFARRERRNERNAGSDHSGATDAGRHPGDATARCIGSIDRFF